MATKTTASGSGPTATSVRDVNAQCLERELAWFNQVLEARIAVYFEQPGAAGDLRHLAPPSLAGDPSEYAAVVNANGFGFDERLVLTLALIPHVRPQALDTLFIRNKNLDKGYTEFGGWRGKMHGGFLPTCETAAFVVAGDDLQRRFDVMRLFEPEHLFARRDILRVDHDGSGEPFFSGALKLSTEYLSAFTTGRHQKPDYGIDFPAKLVVGTLAWSDLVLAPDVLAEVETILAWLRHADTIMRDWGLGRWLKAGYRSLFYGPPGTGKTLTATLIGAEMGADVYRIDLSMIVSKYIGETEKNLANVFDQARHKNWILFFDEADALFGKRTQVSSSHDRFANQEVSYLLQRVEDHPGLVILATNLKANIDEAFARRFQSVVHFPMPDPEQRLRLWSDMLGSRTPRAADVDLHALADRFELSGGAITNVVRHAAVRTLHSGRGTIAQSDLLDGIAKERFKEGKTA
jgi:hypothetical protein